jgi:DNA-binding transcriptional LysR family regulator
MISRMDWDDIRYFLSVARAKQFSAVATRMGVDTATIARRINSLEKSLKTRLFDRRTGCALTQAGERFIVTADRKDRVAAQARKPGHREPQFGAY